MNKLLLLFIFPFLLSKTKAQVVFCPAGAEWRYSFLENNIGTTHNEKISYTGDSILGNETVKVLRHVRFFKYVNNLNPHITFIKQKGDTVFMKNAFTQNSWQILYNFNVLPGHSWQSHVYGQTYTATVDSTNTTLVNAMSLKQIFIKYTSSLTTFSIPVTITERFGNNGYLFNFIGGGVSDGDYFQEFLCYKDLTFGQKQFTSKPCDFVDYVGLNENSLQNDIITVFPNPTNDKLTIETSGYQIQKLNILNTLGQIVYSLEHLNSKEYLDLSFLPAGIYYVSLQSISEQQNIKFLKE